MLCDCCVLSGQVTTGTNTVCAITLQPDGTVCAQSTWWVSASFVNTTISCHYGSFTVVSISQMYKEYCFWTHLPWQSIPEYVDFLKLLLLKLCDVTAQHWQHLLSDNNWHVNTWSQCHWHLNSVIDTWTPGHSVIDTWTVSLTPEHLVTVSLTPEHLVTVYWHLNTVSLTP